MAQVFKATAKQNPGRPGWLVEFRHPLKTDTAGRPGRKTRKGLNTNVEAEAQQLVKQLNQLLEDDSMMSIGAKAKAATMFDARVVEIFYSEIESRSSNARQVREQLLALPTRDEGYANVLMMGVPGAGKTTLVRQLIGSHPTRDRFPSTSVNRTTTFPTEVILKPGKFEAVVTFMSEHETRFEVEECVSAAIVEAVTGSAKQVARAFLEKSDMRFRLKYLLGDISIDSSVADEDPYADDYDPAGLDDVSLEPSVVSSDEAKVLGATIQGFLERITNLASSQKASVERQHGPIADMPAEDRSAALDLIEEQAIESDEYVALVSEILDELRIKFELVNTGRFDKSTTGWPNAWHLKTPEAERDAFLSAVRYFSGIAVRSWGKLLTPLVNGMRVAGPFKPAWPSEQPKLVLIDTEGIGHKANATADLPDHVVTMLETADVVLLVDSAKNAMTNFAAGKALEGVVNAGHTRKLAVVFTHMDAVTGENLKGSAKRDHVYAGVRNVVDNQVAKAVSTEAARFLLAHLDKSTFFLGKLDDYEATPARPELTKLLKHLMAAQPPVFEPVGFPIYKSDNLSFAIQEAARTFRQPWRAILGLEAHPDFNARHWQTIKALSRRYAEGWDDGFVLRPTSNLLAALSSSVSRFLENPIGWDGNPTEEQKRETVDRIKAIVNAKANLPALSTRRLRELPQSGWTDAYALRGPGSTVDRRFRIEGIYEKYVPIPDSRGDREVQQFLDEVKEVVLSAINVVKDEVSANRPTVSV